MRRILVGMGIWVGISSGSAQAAPPLSIIADYDHGSSAEINNQISSLGRIKALSPETDCLFVEADRSVNPSLDAYLGGQATYGGSVQDWIHKLNRHTGYSFRNVIPAFFLDEMQRLRIRVYGVDIDLRSGEGAEMLRALRAYYGSAGRNAEAEQEFVRVGIIQRNAVIARNARQEFAARGCRAAVLIVGSSHLADSVNGIRSVSLLKNLSDEGFRAELY